MAKIDYSKAEREFEQAVRQTRIKDLAEGKPAPTERAISYFGLKEETPRPVTDDTVGKLLREEAAAEEEEETKPQETLQPTEELVEEEPLIVPLEKTPEADVIYKARKQSTRVPKRPQPQPTTTPPGDQFLEEPAPLLVLRKHLLWLKRRHIDNRYELLGTTIEEVFSFRNAERLTPEQIKRIQQLNERAGELKTKLLIELGSQTDETLIEKEQKTQKRKRFNVKDTWIPL